MIFICYPKCSTCRKAEKYLQEHKALGLKDKLPQLNEEEQLQLLAADGMLVKRPLLLTDGNVLVGFKETEWAEKLL